MTKSIGFTFVLFMSAFTGNAQKLPNVQIKSIRAPQQVVINGIFKEWGEQFQAYNHATEIAYTIANDDNNLYLVVQATVRDVINKILRGGLTFAIQKTGKKSDENIAAITYPISGIYLSFRSIVIKSGKPDTSDQTISALTESNNNLLEQHVKLIGIKGIGGIDSLISIYNDNNIKAAGQFDLHEIYTMELSLPLKYLNLSTSDEPNFAYHITLNGYKQIPTFGNPTNMDGSPAKGPGVDRLMSMVAQFDAVKSSKTDFWGEYTLAKKP